MSEIIKIDLNDVIDDGKDIDINVKGKMKHDRRVILWKVPGSFIRQYLMIRISQRARGSDPFLVSYNWSKPKGRRLTSAAIDRLIKNLAKGAKIRKAEIHAHMFRATHANDLQQIRGYTLPAIMERLGWLDLSTAGRYLVRRERVHREYNSLHEYWKEFSRIWRKEEGTDDVNASGDNGGDAAAAPYGHGGGAIEKALQ
jgi:site-specific recombinase XerD